MHMKWRFNVSVTSLFLVFVEDVSIGQEIWMRLYIFSSSLSPTSNLMFFLQLQCFPPESRPMLHLKNTFSLNSLIQRMDGPYFFVYIIASPLS